jgi:hypothetical protein
MYFKKLVSYVFLSPAHAGLLLAYKLQSKLEFLYTWEYWKVSFKNIHIWKKIILK